ncbi:neutral/alkaline non-lysosomal ceramidase N-terminal domain-containing protein [Devosia sp. LjRoot16]|uniref:neutral/alkaline non-lysosomal ceramidase N-terminal domain-containing protein n=1 Tax=unclassified Devosia TaxID=196773 RepID=UPI0006FCA727|nr:neutral/alkaline non-lysosomal ceramidase N-terminal domain-containing protein [Devosia sp. Root105]KQU99418.1 alkaline ceramidase [Devosia sp. Root105]
MPELSPLLAGASIVDITPPAGLMMSGYAARTQPATGSHDALTARAIVVGDTAIVVADVIGLHEESCARIRSRCALPDDRVAVIATHTHGGPVSMAGRGGTAFDADFLTRLEDGCVEAIDRAVAVQRPAILSAGLGDNPGIAFNRRHDGGVIDPTVPVLRIDGVDGKPIAVLTAHACHPVVLAAYNRQYTADFPHYVREALEAASPGIVAVFLTGCAGDISTGHSPHSSISTVPTADRTYAEAERLGRRIAASASTARLRPLAGGVAAAAAAVTLDLERNETAPLPVLAAEWRAKAAESDPAWATLYECWADWAGTVALRPAAPWTGKVTVLDWAGVRLSFLPGEMFAQSALNVRGDAARVHFVNSFADGVPGYIPPASEYPFGGYEVLEAHRYYGLPAAFAEGSAERLEAAAIELNARLDRATGSSGT